jgi:hypothetical protein
MPVIAGETRKVIRTLIGDNLGAFKAIEADATGFDTTFITDDIFGSGADEYRGRWLVFTSGTNDGSIRRIVNSAVTNNRTTYTYFPSTSVATADGDTAEMWDEDYDPEKIQGFINQSIRMTYSRAYDPIEDLSLHGDGLQARFDIPTGISMINVLEYRSRIPLVEIHACERDFDETTTLVSAANQSQDTEDKRRGTTSLKLDVQVGASAGEIITDSIASLDLSSFTHVEGWIKSTVALDAADYVLRLDSGVVQGDGTDLEVLNIPAAAVDAWTPWQVLLANPETDTAIVSVGIEMNVDKGAHVVRFDDIRATIVDRQQWTEVPKRFWYIDKSARDLVLDQDGVNKIGYSMIKIRGGDEPLLLTTDAAVNEIDDQYVVAKATALAFSSQNDARAGLWFTIAQREWGRMPRLMGVREVE